MSVETRSRRSPRGDNTRATILTAAEKLFAEHGIAAVSHRQIVAAARQGNGAAIGYHFGTTTDLVRAIEDKHGDHIESLRTRTISDMGSSPGLRDWVACLVLPLTDHLSAIGTPSWYARFAAQVLTDPTYRRIIIKNSFESASLHHVVEEIGRALPEVPEQELAERSVMMRTMLIYTCAEFERVLAEGNPSPWPHWPAAAHGLIDGIVALMQGPVTRLD
ncbi:TetR family transcriptional regulator [Mycobacterium cookii]|uniref:TetR family transcriptional regulator n=1 Tax=Mycobacterium cookii TaxID=1775 RepID=A0A7I7KV09_9MYCO|nr:TetR/AcrR family transcriptional regulator [Mycobacterium cookii]MCV7329064.1 TetR/AcrR family transcriptional regulator [Mycobacterium cookii]BBX45559.1 TetR family transcriptional regulator [Mycobacterium cookii]